jgi:hypothetical protein
MTLYMSVMPDQSVVSNRSDASGHRILELIFFAPEPTTLNPRIRLR